MSAGFLLGSAAALVGCVTVEAPRRSPVASAQLVRADGVPVGSARLLATGSAMMLQLEVVGLPAGVHGVHLHAVGRCERPDFASAQGHWNPTSRQHGSANPSGPHAGDLPNLTVGVDGRGRMRAPLNAQASAAGTGGIFDGDGTSVIVHASADDMRTDPSGASGARIACGVLSPG